MTLGYLSNYIAIVVLVLGNPTCRCFDNFSKKGKSNKLCALTHQDTPMKKKKKNITSIAHKHGAFSKKNFGHNKKKLCQY